jgi:hypothetical protein
LPRQVRDDRAAGAANLARTRGSTADREHDAPLSREISCILRPGSVNGTDLALRSFAAYRVQTAPEVTGTAQVTRRHIENYKPWLAARPGQNKRRDARPPQHGHDPVLRQNRQPHRRRWYFAVTDKVDGLYQPATALPANSIGLLGNGYCTRPAELDCAFESICETCTFFQTSIQFWPTLQAQHDDATNKGQHHRADLFNRLLNDLKESEAS